MKRYIYPEQSEWEVICARPTMDLSSLRPAVEEVMTNVRQHGDKALLELTARFDGVQLESLRKEVPSEVIIDSELRGAVDLAWANIHAFHAAQAEPAKKVATTEGVVCWRRSIPINKVGLYIPGGSAPLFSTLLMLGIPATIAGCREIVVCTPPDASGEVHPAILYVASRLGLRHIYTVGGAQAIAAMTYGTESVPQVSKIFGPGNQYVTMAKLLAQQDGVSIDMPAGPSEVLVLADASCRPDFVAADLLSQAEHGPDSQVILISDSEEVIDAVERELKVQLKSLPRMDTAKQALLHSRAVLVKSMDIGVALSNTYAPEHLIIATDNAQQLADLVTEAGSVFLGHWSCESAGDYASGTNHTLPTNGHARSYSGVSLDSFVKRVTFQELSPEGLQGIGPSICSMAQAEGLDAHALAVSIRLKSLSDV